MARIGEGLFSRFLGKNISERIRKIWEFKPEDPHRNWQVPPADTKLPGVDHIQGYRYPAPNSRPMANVPNSDDPDALYDTGYFKKDTRRAPRNITSYTAPALEGLVGQQEKARAKLAAAAPADAIIPSKGNKNPAVLKYDPTGLRATMSASQEEMDKSIQKYMPNHLVRPAWADQEADIVAEMEQKGLPPVPGRALVMRKPKQAFVSSW